MMPIWNSTLREIYFRGKLAEGDERLMNKAAFIGFASLLTGCMIANARTAHTGHLFVALTDRETGLPITNASAKVEAQTKWSFAGHSTPTNCFATVVANTDSNGIAHAEFQFINPNFEWWVDAPSHYSGWVGFGCGREEFGCIVEKSDYFNIDTNTVQGLAMYNELVQLDRGNDYLGFLSKFSPKSATYTNNVICRSVCLTPKHNPRPMYAYGGCEDDGYLPKKNPTVLLSNDLEVTKYDVVDFDLKDCLAVSSGPYYDPFLHGPSGRVSDFRIERFRATTNGVVTTFGWLDFAPGCGAYITPMPGDGYFPVIYEADTNATFLSRIPYEYSTISGKVVYASHPVKQGECMVLKTRVSTNEVGEVVGCNYSKIYGPMSVFRKMTFGGAMFNSVVNDNNLEFDIDNNLSNSRKRCYRP